MVRMRPMALSGWRLLSWLYGALHVAAQCWTAISVIKCIGWVVFLGLFLIATPSNELIAELTEGRGIWWSVGAAFVSATAASFLERQCRRAGEFCDQRGAAVVVSTVGTGQGQAT